MKKPGHSLESHPRARLPQLSTGEVLERTKEPEINPGTPIHFIAACLEIPAAISTILASSILIWELLHGSSPNKYLSGILIGLVTANVVLLTLLAVTSFSYNNQTRHFRRLKLEQLRERHWKAARIANDVKIAEKREDISRAHSDYCITLRDAMTAGSDDRLEMQLRNHIGHVLDLTSDLFTIYTQDQCSACVKVFGNDSALLTAIPHISNGGLPPYVFTFQRDMNSSLKRKLIDTKYPIYRYSDNAAFKAILNDRYKPDHYVENNLLSLGDAYFCAHEEWNKFYNATAVVPIAQHGMLVSERCFALLCVDNKNGGFDENRCLHILNSIAMDVYYAMWTTSWLLWKRNEFEKGDVNVSA